MPKDELPVLLTSKEVAELLRQPLSTVAHWRRYGTGPRWTKLGRRVVYEKDDVAAWYEQQYSTRGR